MSMVNRDDEHLRLLSILYYVWGGMTALFSCLGIFYVFGGALFTTFSARDADAPAWMGVIIAMIGVVVVVLGWTIGGLTIWAGRCLATRRHYTFCFIIAALACLSVPIGTALGVFTMIVLSRPSVKQLFSPTAASAPATV